MKNKWTFKFRQNRPSNNRPISFEAAEKIFLAKLNDPNENQQAVRRELVLLYRSTSRTTDTMFYAEEYLAHTTNLEERAEMYFFIGQAMEHANDFEAAYRFYMLALNLKPCNVFYRFFLNNNIGYSLNQLARYVEAENYTREAIHVDPNRANGHKNLGLALEGQGRYAEAVRSFIDAVQANASDPRALRHLEELVGRHPETFAEIPDLRDQIEMCRLAVQFAAQRNMN